MKSDVLSEPVDRFAERHIGPTTAEIRKMLEYLGLDSIERLIEAVVPGPIRSQHPLAIGDGEGEHALLEELHEIAKQNRVARSYLGMGYHAAITPAVIQRNVLENPGWYTQYTPYQAEIAQGRLEALVNFQTLICELTALPVANASLLDEATAAAEAMTLSWARSRRKKHTFFADSGCHPQTLAVLRTRARPLGITIVTDDPAEIDTENPDLFGALVQYPVEPDG